MLGVIIWALIFFIIMCTLLPWWLVLLILIAEVINVSISTGHKRK